MFLNRKPLKLNAMPILLYLPLYTLCYTHLKRLLSASKVYMRSVLSDHLFFLILELYLAFYLSGLLPTGENLVALISHICGPWSFHPIVLCCPLVFVANQDKWMKWKAPSRRSFRATFSIGKEKNDRLRSALSPGSHLFSMCLQLFCGLPVTLAGLMTLHSAAGHQKTQARGGRSSLVAPLPLTLGLTWTIQVRDTVWMIQKCAS